MKNILKFTFCLFFTSLVYQGFAQEDTPYFWLTKARTSILASDTLQGIADLHHAIQLGLFDPQAITNNKTLSFLAQDIRGREVMAKIFQNRLRLSDPSKLRIETGDIDRFWENFDSIHEPNAENIFLKNYIQEGSLGLKTFYSVRMNRDLEKYLDRVRSLESYYRSIRPTTLKFESLKPDFIRAAQKLKELYPDAIFPPIYFLMGSLSNVGTPDGWAGMLIGAEHLSTDSNSNLDSLSEWEQKIIFDFDQTVPIIVHEYVHLQQKNTPESTLLDLAIMEGAADFITYLILGQPTDPHVFDFGVAHEEKLWAQFKTQMRGENTDDWLFNTYDPETGYPGNLGYFIGYRICESYYQSAENKKSAIKEMLEIRDYEQFLKDSGYGSKHKKNG